MLDELERLQQQREEKIDTTLIDQELSRLEIKKKVVAQELENGTLEHLHEAAQIQKQVEESVGQWCEKKGLSRV